MKEFVIKNKETIIMIGMIGTISVLSAIILLLTLAATFPEEFEARGITIFHNKKTGIFAECLPDQPNDDPACSKLMSKELERKILSTRVDTKTLRKPRIVPFTFN